MGNLCCGGDSASTLETATGDHQQETIFTMEKNEAPGDKLIKPLPILVSNKAKELQQDQIIITPEMNIWPPPEPETTTTITQQIELNIWPPPPTSAPPTKDDKPHSKKEESFTIHKTSKPDTIDDADTVIQNNLWPPPSF